MSEDHPEEIRMLVGDIALKTSGMELQIAQVVRRARHKPWSYAKNLASQPNNALNGLKTYIESLSPGEEADELGKLLTDARQAVQDRNSVVHSVTVRMFDVSGEDLGTAFFDPRVADENQAYTPADEAPLIDLCKRLEELSERASRIRMRRYPPPPDRKPWPLGPTPDDEDEGVS